MIATSECNHREGRRVTRSESKGKERSRRREKNKKEKKNEVREGRDEESRG